jgi:hypothetical protein
MRCTVVCNPAAADQLARIWLRAIDKTAISRAANKIDQLLRTSPETVGQPHRDCYLLVCDCLAVQYRFSPDDCLVEILSYELILS